MLSHLLKYSKWVSKLSTLLFVSIMCWILYLISPMKKPLLLSEKQTNKSIELLKGYYEHKIYSNAKPLSDDVFSQQTLKFFANLCILTAAVGTNLFRIYPSVYNNFRHLCFFTQWLSSDFQRVQQRPASDYLHRRSPQVRNHSGAGHAGLPSSCQAREIFF